MSDEKKITSLAEARSKRERKKMEQAHAQGKAFRLREIGDGMMNIGLAQGKAFRLREIGDGMMNIGLADTGAIVLIAEGELDGFVMSREYARKLGRALLEAADAEIPAEEVAK